MDQRKEAAAPNTRHTVATSEYCVNTELPAGYLLMVLTLWRWKTIYIQCDAENTEHPLKSVAKNMQSNKCPIKSQVFHRVHWILNSSAKELNLWGLFKKFEGCLQETVHVKLILWNTLAFEDSPPASLQGSHQHFHFPQHSTYNF